MSEALARENDISASPWSVSTLRDYFLGLIAANDRRYSEQTGHLREMIAESDRRYEQRFRAQETAIASALLAQEKAVAAALTAVKEATDRFAEAFETRMANTNEWRQTVENKDRTLMPRSEAEAVANGIKEKLETLSLSFREQRANGSGMASGWSMAIAAVGLITFVMGLLTFLLKK